MADASAKHDRRTGKFTEKPEKADHERFVAERRRDGLTFREIADELGCAESTVCRHYQAVQQRTRAAAEDAVEDVVQTELERLDRSIAKVTPLLEDPTQVARAAEVLEKLSASRRKLLGLDKPTRHEVSGPEGAPIPIDARASLLDRLAGLVSGGSPAGTPGSDPGKPQ